MIYLAADHRGFKLKEELKKYLTEGGYEVEDMGAFEYEPDDDYPDFAFSAARKVAENPKDNRGIFLCGSGIGMDFAANKVRGIRATVACSAEAARHARTNDDVNVITLAGDILSFTEAREIVDVFLNTEFTGAERHVRRLKKIAAIEEKSFR